MEPTDHLLAEARRYGYVENEGVWLRPVLGQPARQIGTVKESDATALRYFVQRYELLRSKVDDVLEKMETDENGGSHLMKALHLKEQLLSYNGLGDFETLHRRITEAETAMAARVVQNREKNLAAKLAFIAEAEALRHSVEWVSASEKVKDLRQGWLKTGPVDKHLTAGLETRFQAAVQAFFDRRKAFQADKKAMVNRAQTRYRELIFQAEKLKSSDQFEATSRQLKQLQQAWREVNGNLPKKQASELWTRFRAANNHFFERLKAHIQSQQASAVGQPATPEVLLARKRALAERAEALMRVPPQEAIHQAKALQAEWKQVGTVRGEESDRIWHRFMVACDKIFELSALEYHLRKRLPGAPPEGNTPAEKARFRATTLRELLKDDHAELATLQDNLDKLNPIPANEAFRQMLQTKIRSFERKIRTKNDLIKLFTEQAQAAG